MKIEVPGHGSVSALLDKPQQATALLVLAHGAGAGMKHSAMQALVEALNGRGIATLRFNFPYMERGSKRPDSPDTAVAAIVAACAAAKKVKLPLFAGGRSFGGRMTTTAAARGELPGVLGILCFGFPLHPPKKPDTKRAGHLSEVSQPILMVQGTRDDLSDLKLLRSVTKKLRKVTLHIVEGADHGYGVLKSSGRTREEVLAEVADASFAFCTRHA